MMQRLTPQLVEAFLVEAGGTPVGQLSPISQGEWSTTYSFDQSGRSWIVRFSDHAEDFQKDRVAYAYHSPALPVPEVVQLGEAFGGYFAISRRLPGTAIDLLDAATMGRVVPAVLALLDALRVADISGSEGYGSWLPDRRGVNASWKEVLLSIGDDPPGNRIGGWKEKLSAAAGLAAYSYLRQKMAALVNYCPEGRHLIHGDLLHYNLLVAGDRISAVLDWGNSMYGDFLYELAWFTFWAPWHPGMAGIDFRKIALAHYSQIGLEVTNFEQRLACYELYIGLDSIAYCAFTDRWSQVEQVTSQALEVAERVE
jgi:hygromycin-B 4-O-kinase